MQPYNVKTTKKDLIARLQNHEKVTKNMTFEQPQEQKISPEIKKQVEEMGKRWERMGINFHSTAPIKEYPTQVEIKAARVLDFASAVSDDKPRSKRWRNQS
jgi:hypothetical protein